MKTSNTTQKKVTTNGIFSQLFTALMATTTASFIFYFVFNLFLQ